MMCWASISREAKKRPKKKFALVTPKQRGSKKIKILSQYQGPRVRDQGLVPGPGTGTRGKGPGTRDQGPVTRDRVPEEASGSTEILAKLFSESV